MQAGVEFLRQFYRHRRRTVAGFNIANNRVLIHGNVFAIFRSCRRHVGSNGGLIFTMGGHEHWALLKNPFEYLRGIYEHVSGWTSHKHFDSANVFRVGFKHLINVVVARSHEEAIIRWRHLSCAIVFILKQLLSKRVWNRVGHLHKRGDSTRNSRSWFCCNFSFMS